MDPRTRSHVARVAVPRSAMLRDALRHLPGVAHVRTWPFHGSIAGIKQLSPLKRRHMYRAQREIDLRDLTDRDADEDPPLPLESLALHNASIANLHCISSLSGLRSLDLALADVDREHSSFKWLASLTQLQSLNLNRTGLSELEFLQALSQLHTLSIAGAAVASLEGLAAVGATLTSLDVSNVWLEHELVNLSTLTKLRELRADLLGAMDPLDIRLDAPQLEMCSLRNCWLAHRDFLLQCPQLARLDLRDTILFDSASAPVVLPQLTTLQVSSNPAAIRSFDWHQTSNIETLRLQKWNPAFVDGERIDGAFIGSLPRLKTLEIAKLSKYSSLPAKSPCVASMTIHQLKSSHVAALVMLIATNDRLEALSLCAEAAVSMELPPLAAPARLRELRLVNVTLTSLDGLAQCRHLGRLEVSGFGTIPSAAALDAFLPHCAELKTLKICQNTAFEDLAPIAQLRQLQVLSVRHTNVRSLAPLTTLRALQELDVGYTHVADVSPLRALARLQRVVLPSGVASCALFHDADAFPMLRSVVHERVDSAWDCLRTGHEPILPV